MAYCTECGAKLNDDAKFCSVCGASQKSDGQRKQSFEGKIFKCPSCGCSLSSFLASCPECGYEIRGSGSSESVSHFAQRYAMASTDRQRLDLIRIYVIPNTKEDILEFAILASSNINSGTYIELSNAWMVKLEQAYQKAIVLLKGYPELDRITNIYNQKKKTLGIAVAKTNTKKVINHTITKKILKPIIVVLVIIICFFLIKACVDFNKYLDEQKIEEQAAKDEQKLKEQAAKIETYIAKGDYDAALTLAYAMNDNYSKGWSEIRTNFISRIKTLQGKIQIPISNKNAKDKQYTDIILQYEQAGFWNVTAEKVPDLVTGWLHKEGEVIEVSIDGSTSFSAEDFFNPDVVIIVRYHAFK